jgi:hypothetical protein
MPPTQPTQPEQLSKRLDKELAGQAARKLMSGQQPTAEERAALRRHERVQEEQRRWQYYESIPQKHWRQMSGRQTKILAEQADRYGLPFGGRTVNLPKLVRALHEFLAANARKLAGEDGMTDAGSSSPALEQYRKERARLARLDRLAREGTLVSRENVRDGLGRIAHLLRAAAEALERQYGKEAGQLLDEALDDAQREIDRLFGEKRRRNQKKKPAGRNSKS